MWAAAETLTSNTNFAPVFPRFDSVALGRLAQGKVIVADASKAVGFRH